MPEETSKKLEESDKNLLASIRREIFTNLMNPITQSVNNITYRAAVKKKFDATKTNLQQTKAKAQANANANVEKQQKEANAQKNAEEKATNFKAKSPTYKSRDGFFKRLKYEFSPEKLRKNSEFVKIETAKNNSKNLAKNTKKSLGEKLQMVLNKTKMLTNNSDISIIEKSLKHGNTIGEYIARKNKNLLAIRNIYIEKLKKEFPDNQKLANISSSRENIKSFIEKLKTSPPTSEPVSTSLPVVDWNKKPSSKFPESEYSNLMTL